MISAGPSRDVADHAGEHLSLAAPDLRGNEERYVLEALRSGWLSAEGSFVDRFEREFATATGTAACLAVCNGTSGLHLALLGLGIGPGDEVLVPALSFVAVANAVTYVGAIPVFCDIDPATWCIDPADIERRLTPRSRAIIPVHLYGHPADMDAINAIASKRSLSVIEDAAEAYGATYKGRPVGGLGDVGVFSFYGNKVLTSGEGGAVTANDPALAARMRLLRGQGMDPNRRYYFPVVGHNFRPTNIGCAILCAQLERAPEMLRLRRQLFALYRLRLAGTPGVGLQPVAGDVAAAPWLYSITISANQQVSRDAVMAELGRSNIETRPFFIPLHQLPPYSAGGLSGGERAHADGLAASGINLPTSSTMTAVDVHRVCDAVLDAVSG